MGGNSSQVVARGSGVGGVLLSKVAFLFPGQGSQQVGMGKSLVEEREEAKEIFDQADQVLGYSLSKLCFEGPEEELRLTANTQPAILTNSVALWSVLQKEIDLTPDYVAGHSLGEYSALVAADSFSFADAVWTVHKRGTYMEQAVPAGVGSMSAVLQLDREKLDEICREVSTPDLVVQPANYNCPGQIVISGHKEAVEKAGTLALEVGARRVVPLVVSGPFHSQLMEPAQAKLSQALTEVQIDEAKVPVVANVTAKSVTKAEEIRDLLIQQVAAPVLWEDTVRYLLDQGVTTFVEIGAGNVLAGLVRKVDRKVKVLNVQDLTGVEKAKEYFQQLRK